MTTYCKIDGSTVVNRAQFDGAMPDDWAAPDDLWVADEAAQIGWSYAGGVFSAPAPEVQPVDLKAYAADKRWRVETGGIVVNGATIQTDRASQAMITGLYTYAAVAKPDSIPFKAEGGFVSLTAAEAVAIGLAVGAHVQACFAAEQVIDADIAQAVITTAAQVETDSRWPAAASG